MNGTRPGTQWIKRLITVARWACRNLLTLWINKLQNIDLFLLTCVRRNLGNRLAKLMFVKAKDNHRNYDHFTAFWAGQTDVAHMDISFCWGPSDESVNQIKRRHGNEHNQACYDLFNAPATHAITPILDPRLGRLLVLWGTSKILSHWRRRLIMITMKLKCAKSRVSFETCAAFLNEDVFHWLHVSGLVSIFITRIPPRSSVTGEVWDTHVRRAPCWIKRPY